jgi:hypothetical protein
MENPIKIAAAYKGIKDARGLEAFAATRFAGD